jgi:hypothetical protein
VRTRCPKDASSDHARYHIVRHNAGGTTLPIGPTDWAWLDDVEQTEKQKRG